jgi:hypothetical protein
MKQYFKEPLKNREDVETFFTKLFLDDLLFHPEDDPSDIIYLEEDSEIWEERVYVPLFNEEENIKLRQRLDEVFEHHEDPCKFIVDTFYKPNDY